MRLRDFLCYKHSVIAKHSNAVANIQCLHEFLEFYVLSAEIYLYRMADLRRLPTFNLIVSVTRRD